MTRLPRPRSDLAELAPYRTQQMPAAIRLQANEWAEPTPADTYLGSDELHALLLNRYPHPGEELRALLGARFGVAAEQILLGNGSNEVLLTTFLAFGGHGRTTLLFQPTYSMHDRLALTAGGTVTAEHIGLPYRVTPERARAALARVKPHIVVFCTPNNPTGDRVPEETIVETARTYPETLVIVDEAYADFAGFTHVPLIATYPNVVVSRTFSKARAAAGLRLGVLVAHPEIAATYRAVQLPYNINAITLALGERIVRDEAATSRRVGIAQAERARIATALAGIPAIEAFPSDANFILFRAVGADATALHRRFLDRGVLVRDVSSGPGLAGCLRVTVGTPAENDAFIAALAPVLGEVKR